MQNQCRWFRETRNQDFYYVYYNTFSRFLLFNFCTFSRLFSIKKGCPEADSSKIEGDNPQQNSDSKSAIRVYIASLFFVLPVVQQCREQHHKAGAGVVDQGPGGGVEQLQQGCDDGEEVDAHGQCDAQLDGLDRGVGQPL